MDNRRILLFEEDAVGNRDWFFSTPYHPGDAYNGKLKRLLKYIRFRRREVDKILRQEHGWVGQITTKIVWKINDQPVTFQHFYKSQFRGAAKSLNIFLPPK